MNIKTIILSGLMTALIGAMLGLAVAHIAERPQRKKVILITGATLGFTVGALQAIVREQKEDSEDDSPEMDQDQ